MSAAAAAVRTVLVADDQEDIRLALRLALKGHGLEIETADSPDAIVAAVARRSFDAVLMDLNYTRDTTSGAEGLDVLPRLKELDADLPIIVMTAWGTIELAVEAMRRGASNFVLKPWDDRALLETLHGTHRNAGAVTPRRTARDLEVAGRIQNRLLPQALPALATLECAARCVEAGAVGGDGYDFVDLGHGRSMVLLADVSGKGVAAALLWASLQATLRSQAARAASDLGGLLRSVNRTFLDSTAPEHYATLFIGVYDDATRRLRYVNCGHPAPLVLRADGSSERLPATAPVIGLLEEWEGVEQEIGLQAKDTLLLYSDGVSEASDARSEEFGEGRLVESLREARALPIARLPEAILAAAKTFAAGEPQDDMTVLALRGRASARREG
jgi:sigma-B regulation protein RsbU (phosphoserine phosphatase)